MAPFLTLLVYLLSFCTLSLKEKKKKTSSTDFTIFICNHHRVKIKFDIKLEHGYAEIKRAVIFFLFEILSSLNS